MKDVSSELAHEAEVALRKCGANRDFWKKIIKNPDLAQKVVEFVNTRLFYNVVIDYTRSIQEMIEAGDYYWANSSIATDHFLPVPIDQGRHECEVVLFHFNHPCVTSEEISAEMKKGGYRSARIKELLALGEAQPNLQREFPIVALGSACQEGRNYYVPQLWSDIDGRILSLIEILTDWNEHYRFAAVRES